MGAADNPSQGKKGRQNKPRKEKAAKVSQSAPTTPTGSDTEEEEGEGSCSQAAVIRHKLFQVQTQLCKTIVNPTPRL